MKTVQLLILLCLLGFLPLGCVKGGSQDVTSADPPLSMPNVVLIIADDQAYGDLSVFDNPVAKTPNLDKLAGEGFLAERFYVSPVCAPTRASVLTGRYYQRMGVTGVTRGRENMNLDEVTLANMLKEAGYSTGLFGKWHNGAHFPYHPLGRGFDNFVGFTSGHWSNYFDTVIEKNGSSYTANGYLPDVLTEESISFIRKSASQGKPFFCYISFPTPHTPLQVPDVFFDKYKAQGVDDFNATIYGMGENIDWNVGRVLEELDRLNIDEETLVIYLSDNGPLNFRFNKDLKGRKGMVDEGGVRVPFIARWKGKIKTGIRSETALAHIDLVPTILDLINLSPESDPKFDGVSFKSALTETSKHPSVLSERLLFENWQGHKRVLKGDSLLIDEQLFDLDSDPSQSVSIREDDEARYAELLSSFMDWKAELPEKIMASPIPVGYEAYPIAVLPAHEAILLPSFEFGKDRRHTGIAYHSRYGWAHDWIDNWTKENAFASWEVDVKTSGDYEVALRYALAEENKGCEMILEIGDKEIVIDSLDAFIHTYKPSQDRIPREQEAPETDWAFVRVGSVEIEEGRTVLSLKANRITGSSAIELKEVVVTKKSN